MNFSTKSIDIKYGKLGNYPMKRIRELNKQDMVCRTVGEIKKIEVKNIIYRDRRTGLNKGATIYDIFITDYEDSLMATIFANDKEQKEEGAKLKKGMGVVLQGKTVIDPYSDNDCKLNVYAFAGVEGMQDTKDISDVKRVEFNLKTKFSGNSVIEVSNLINQIEKMGHKIVAITDEDNCHAFPFLWGQEKDREDFKVIYGVETSISSQNELYLRRWANSTYVVFDVETTGLNRFKDEIIEIGAIKVINGKVVGEFQTLIKPKKRISKDSIKIHGITDSMVENCKGIEEILPQFLEFIGDLPLVAHNIMFDISMIDMACRKLGLPRTQNKLIDTLELSRFTHYYENRHSLDRMVARYNIELKKHHRVIEDSRATKELYERLSNNPFRVDNFKTLVYMKNNEGRENFVKVINKSHVDFLKDNLNIVEGGEKVDKKVHKNIVEIPKKELNILRDNLIIGSSATNGEFILTLLAKGVKKAKEVAKFYDFLEVHPLGLYQDMINKGFIKDIEGVKRLIKDTIQIGKEVGLPIIATCGVKHLQKREYVHFKVLKTKFPNPHNKPHYKEVNFAHFLTTNEMLEEFDFLGHDKAYEIVVKNTRDLADRFKKIDILPSELQVPKIAGVEEYLLEQIDRNLKNIYGEKPPKEVIKRLEYEKDIIFGRTEDNNINFGVLYWIALKLVEKSKELGYMVGSRGSVGSSFLAYISGISEVNPLKPHYNCPKCQYTDFEVDISNGFDLENKPCPKCEGVMIGQGHNIPFESFVGIGRIKPPDIDLNFAPQIQEVIHDYVREIFGEEKILRAGTILLTQEKRVEDMIGDLVEEGYVNPNHGYGLLKTNLPYLTNIKYTTGQHPGGLLIFPKEFEVDKWLPIQHSANKKNNSLTTHYDYNALEEVFIKIDALSQDTSAIARVYEDLIGIDYETIPMNDKKVIENWFREGKAHGISEFATPFVQEMLKVIEPKTFNDLIRISGLSHGTNVWLGNALNLIEKEICNFSEVIACRDDIMLDLINKGMDRKKAFSITDKVRKGRGLTDEEVVELIKIEVPNWYIQSCQKIKYLFPKAHAVAYTINSYKQAYMKEYHPLAFYCAYFTTKFKHWKWEVIGEGREVLEHRIKTLERIGFNKHLEDENIIVNGDEDFKVDEKMELLLLKVFEELTKRGFILNRVKIKESKPFDFTITESGEILPPLITLKGLGATRVEQFLEWSKGKLIKEVINCKEIDSRTGRLLRTTQKVRVKNSEGKTVVATNLWEGFSKYSDIENYIDEVIEKEEIIKKIEGI